MSTTTQQSFVRKKLHDYGLGVLFAGNVFGAGSVYILADTGANFAFALLWVLPLAFLIDIAMHDMSARLAVEDKPLAEYITRQMPKGGPVLLVAISLMSALWAVSNYAVAGAALAWLLPFTSNILIGIVLAAGIGIALVQLKLYDRIEGAIATMVFAVFGSYGLLLAGIDVNVTEVASGLVPLLNTEIGYLTAVIALLGTTVYWPNFFVQSSIHPTKGWTDIWKYRRDNAFGIMVTLVVGSFVMIISAVTLSQGELSLTAPGQPLVDAIGPAALFVFVVAVFFASITSATGTLFGAGFIVPQAMNKKTIFGDQAFRATVITLIMASVPVALMMLTYTDFTPVRLAILMPAVNGIIGLPVTSFGMWLAINKYTDVKRSHNIAFGLSVFILMMGSVLTAQSLYDTIVSLL